MNEEQERIKKIIKKVLIGFIVIMALTVFFGSFGTVGAGERGIRLRFDAVTGEPLGEGLYWKTPFIERVIVMNVKIQKEEVTATAASNDLQDVTSVVALNFHINPAKVNIIYQEVGLNYDDVIIAPAIQEAVKDSTAQFTAEELITKRTEVREKIQTLLIEKIEHRGIIVDAFNIVDLNFSASFNKAIEAKVTALQEALKAENDLERIKFEAQQQVAEAQGKADARIAEAEAEAKAIRIQAQSISAQGGQAYIDKIIAERWNGQLPVYMLNDVVPFINIGQ